VQWVWNVTSCNYAVIKFTRESRRYWRGITEPGDTFLDTSVLGNHQTENPHLVRNTPMLWLLHGQKLDAGMFHQHHSDFAAVFLL
jgi:hypothetical protein